MRVKTLLNHLRKRIIWGNKSDSQTYIIHLKQIGMRIGERTQIFDPPSTLIGETRPWLIDIGDDVQITQGVTILTHGYDWAVLKGVYGDILGSSGGENWKQCIHWNELHNLKRCTYR